MWQDTMFEPVSNVSLLSGPSFKTVQQNKVHFIYIQKKKMMKTALNIAIKSGRGAGEGEPTSDQQQSVKDGKK